MQKLKIGIIGGSGLYEIEGIKNIREQKVTTPFGSPSDKITVGDINGVEIAFLPRHGKGHRIMPSEINYRANIYAMKKIGVNYIISVSAVGSLKKELKPGDIVVVDQFIDHTKGRVSTFFGDGIVAHVSLADPVCSDLSHCLYKTAKSLSLPVVNKGTYICIEGPHFSTRAESNMFRKLYTNWGADVIGMTNVPESKLAREAEICYSTLAFVTDYDCWLEGEEDVSVEMVIKTLTKNIDNAKKIIKKAIPEIGKIKEKKCKCTHALKNAIITSPKHIPLKRKKELSIILEK